MVIYKLFSFALNNVKICKTIKSVCEREREIRVNASVPVTYTCAVIKATNRMHFNKARKQNLKSTCVRNIIKISDESQNRLRFIMERCWEMAD